MVFGRYFETRGMDQCGELVVTVKGRGLVPARREKAK